MPRTPSPARAGLDEIIAGTGLSLDELIAAKRLFVQDYTPFASTLKPSPGNVAEAPTALFFLDGADDADAALMPLAIKFNLQNQNVYSPKDSRADWLLVRRLAGSRQGRRAAALPAAPLWPGTVHTLQTALSLLTHHAHAPALLQLRPRCLSTRSTSTS